MNLRKAWPSLGHFSRSLFIFVRTGKKGKPVAFLGDGKVIGAYDLGGPVVQLGRQRYLSNEAVRSDGNKPY
jgi:hypothetical protein